MISLENIRKKFDDGAEQFAKFLEGNKGLAEFVIQDVAKEYQHLDGHGKLETAIQFLLQRLPFIPAFIATVASQKIVDITEKFIQNQYDAMKDSGKI